MKIYINIDKGLYHQCAESSAGRSLFSTYKLYDEDNMICYFDKCQIIIPKWMAFPFEIWPRSCMENNYFTIGAPVLRISDFSPDEIIEMEDRFGNR